MLDPNDEVYLRLFSKQEGNSKSKQEKSAFKNTDESYQERIDISQLKPLSSGELRQILGLTIKKDDDNNSQFYMYL